MRFLVVLFGIFGIFFLIFKLVAKRFGIPEKNFKKIAILVFVTIFILLGVFFRYEQNLPDHCFAYHTVSYNPPTSLKTAMDFFDMGNYRYDRGDCTGAIADYTRAIEMNQNFPQAYNNRGYTFMRMKDYKDALPDFDKAIELRPDYVQALMNRGDLYNFWGPVIDRQKAIADYNKVISLGKEKDPSGSVCGHKALAENNNVLPLLVLRFITHTDCQ